MAKQKVRSEHEEQSALMAWCLTSEVMQDDQVRRLALHWTYATPNGFYRGFAARRKAKAEGVKSGILDLTVPAPELRLGVRKSGAYHGLYIEMKKRGAAARPTQVEFMDYLALVHYRAALCYTWRAAARIIVEHLDLEKFYPIPEDDVDDTLHVSRMVEEASRIDAELNPPKPKPDKVRNARPRKTANERKKDQPQ